MRDFNFNFPKKDFDKFIESIGWDSLENWVDFCEKNKFNITIRDSIDCKFREDWNWGLLFPLVSKAYNICKFNHKRKLIGVSALPGTGKTTLGFFIEKLSNILDLKICVISMDDFYLPKKEMAISIKDNPWNVSRGFPGSHSINLMKKSLSEWKETGFLNVPVFDKSLNNGLGDRSHWRNEYPDLVILEGWFLGVKPIKSKNIDIEDLQPPLSYLEISYRHKIQNNLRDYLDIWNLLDDLWHLRPQEFSFLNTWKIQQEKEMLYKKGSALRNKKLLNFLRMLNTSIPQKSFEEIKSDYLFIINQDRRIIWAGINN